MANRPPTGSDVARVAGVSKSAVSRAFTGGLVSDDARERIFAAAKQLRYRPSLAARSLATNQSRLIGVAITHLDNHFYPQVIEKLSEQLDRAGYRIVLFITRATATEADLDPVLDELLRYRLDGVILASSSMAARLAAECTEAQVPVLMFNNIDPDGRAPGISADNVAGAATIARYFKAAGHHRLAVISGLAESSTSIERTAGFIDAARAEGLPDPLVESGGFSFDGARAAVGRLLAMPEPPDAIFCVNDHMALAAIQELRSHGIEPGGAVSLAGFDNVGIAEWPAFALTTYAQPIDTMVATAVCQLTAAIDGGQTPIGTEYIRGKLIIRATTRLAPGVLKDDNGNQYWPDDLIF